MKSYDTGILFYLQKIPYLRLLYRQYKNDIDNNEDMANQIVDETNKEKYSEILNSVMQKIEQISIANNVKIMVLYHPQLILNKDGSVSPSTDNAYLEIFEKSCSKNNIFFVDMADVFVDEYKANHVLPHGFSNTAVGAGHLNKNGHKMVANELFKQINKISGGGSI
jgi:hypothetical protein